MNDADSTRGKSRGPSDEELERAVPGGAGGREIRVGIFVLVGLIASLAVLYLLTDPAFFRGRYMLTTQVEDALGLRTGDPVQMRGVNIGRVHGFDIQEESVVITLEIEGAWEVPADSRTRLVTTSLLGGRTVEIVPGRSEERAREGQALPGASGADPFSMVDNLGGQATEVLTRVRTLLSEPTVSSLQESARELEALLASLGQITAEQRDDLAQLTATLNRAAEGLEETATSPELDRALARADSTFSTLNETSTSLRRASESLDRILGRIDRGEGTLGQLAVNDTLYDSLTRTLESLDALLVDLKKNPGRYVKLEIF